MAPRILEQARKLLCALQAELRDTLIAARARRGHTFAKVAGVTAADTIYQVDRISEAAILAWFGRHWPRAWPVELVMEGLEDHGSVTFPRGTPVARTVFKCILDPIDGTRNLMYDKRSAWALAALAPQRGANTHLGDIVVAAMTELPTSKQSRADQLSAVRGRGVIARTCDLRTGRSRAFRPRPSRATGFEHGFASIARFFPEGKALLGRIEEDLWRELGLLGRNGGQLVFDDQYLSSGGQVYELTVGHDRMLGDLRPMVYAHLGLGRASLCCHPYDICTALILAEAGGVVETPEGKPLRVPLDTTTPVAWMGYANPTLARRVRPILRRLLRRHLG
ncbi:MAG TPA: inositol monophosphatase [Opitutaceae bacterium]|nr:inositol monophosphatase [Opitutaceae bacterium]HND60839.1 inositol monophosphatase [Opitutaceae bacterium]